MNIEQQTTQQPIQFFRLRDLIKPSFDLWLIAWVLGLVTAVSVVGLLMVSGWFLTATAFAGMLSLGVGSFNYLMPSALIRVLAISRTAGRYGELMVSHNAIFNLLKELRVKFFSTLAKEPLTSQHKTLQSSQQMHRLVSDINVLNEFNLRVIMPWSLAIIMVGLLAVFILFTMPSLTTTWQAMLMVLLGLCLILPAVMSYLDISHSREVAKLTEKRREALLAPLTIITQLLMWKQWQKQTQNFIAYDEHLHQLDWQSSKYRSLTLLVMQWLIYTLMAVVLIAVVYFAPSANWSNIPMLLAIILGLFGMQEILLPLAQHYLSFGNATASKERLNELLNKQVSKPQSYRHGRLTLPETNLHMTLNKVSAKIPTAIVGADNVIANIRQGVPMIISGMSGCGKSTLLQTLANELEPQSGQILLNDMAWQDYDWQDQLGYLGQQLDIFDQTLADNLRLGKTNATNDELIAVLHKVALTDWLSEQPQGLETRLGEYGTAISGGQARRIALARLLLKHRKVLLLDEPFAGLDKDSQQKVWQAVKEHQKSAILIVVSHHQIWQNIGKVDRLELK
ncbi:MAG: ATP-binding cassette domain-containing protein [Moraxellaceae bacterium]|nr:ATP-binding cassette domain-containing protein [Moraxellaceae bacterium]